MCIHANDMFSMWFGPKRLLLQNGNGKVHVQHHWMGKKHNVSVYRKQMCQVKGLKLAFLSHAIFLVSLFLGWGIPMCKFSRQDYCKKLKQIQSQKLQENIKTAEAANRIKQNKQQRKQFKVSHCYQRAERSTGIMEKVLSQITTN